MARPRRTAESWMIEKWRPLMAITYMVICLFDFIAGPVFFNLLQFNTAAQTLTMWKPLTLEGSGLFHLAMGAVLGVTAWTRGQEKIVELEKGAESNGK